MPDDDIIKMDTDITLQDNKGNPIPVNVQSPEYITETFSFKPSKVYKGDE